MNKKNADNSNYLNNTQSSIPASNLGKFYLDSLHQQLKRIYAVYKINIWLEKPSVAPLLCVCDSRLLWYVRVILHGDTLIFSFDSHNVRLKITETPNTPPLGLLEVLINTS